MINFLTWKVATYWGNRWTFMMHHHLNPWTSTHFCSRLSTAEVRWVNFCLLNLLNAKVIAFFRDEMEAYGGLFLLNTILLSTGQSQKSAGVRSGEYGGQKTGKCFPTTLLEKLSLISFLDFRAVWDDTPSYMNHADLSFWSCFSWSTNQDTQSQYVSLFTLICEPFLWKK